MVLHDFQEICPKKSKLQEDNHLYIQRKHAKQERIEELIAYIGIYYIQDF